MRDKESLFAARSYSHRSSSMVSGKESIPSKYGVERNFCFKRRGKRNKALISKLLVVRFNIAPADGFRIFSNETSKFPSNLHFR